MSNFALSPFDHSLEQAGWGYFKSGKYEDAILSFSKSVAQYGTDIIEATSCLVGRR